MAASDLPSDSVPLTGFAIGVAAEVDHEVLVTALCDAGAEVFAASAGGSSRDRLLDLITGRRLDALVLTGAAAAQRLTNSAARRGLAAELHAALSAEVVVACIEPVAGLEVAVSAPHTDALIKELGDFLAVRTPQLTVAGRRLAIRGRLVLVDGEPREMPPAAVALLRVLVRQPGHVVSRAELLRALPGGRHKPHAVDSAISRLRATIGDPRLVQTVVKRGYRLCADD
ncbi:winged helix-turn-helix domain-containing protein [Fodinicola acaciae]|uniref:winged helix-turn-helix domain-containing protein n=1 Tax=Fodinicola acaciae TaxID=2681555 RepID=UPI0013D08186|nr:winged helix-turn-helix domain-containing protein [Fodinicola acaciae]